MKLTVRSKLRIERFTTFLVTQIVLMVGVPTTVHALDGTCTISLYREKGVTADTAAWRDLGYQVEADEELADFSDANRARKYWAARPGTAVVFRNTSAYTLIARANWKDPIEKEFRTALTLNNRLVKQGFGVDRPNCALLTALVDRAHARVEMSNRAIGVLNGTPDPKFSWSEFVLSIEDAISLREGRPLNSAQTAASTREWLKGQRAQANDPTIPFMKRLERAAIATFKFYSLSNYCAAGASLASSRTRGCTNCQGNTLAMITAIKDMGLVFEAPYELGVQIYLDHVQPVVFDHSRNRFRILVGGGAWQTLVDAPIYKPEYVLEALVRSPVSGVLAESLKAKLFAEDVKRGLIFDPSIVSSPLPTWMALKLMKKPAIDSIVGAGLHGHGTFGYVNWYATERFQDGEPPAHAHISMAEFSDREVRTTKADRQSVKPVIGFPDQYAGMFLRLNDSLESLNAEERTLVQRMMQSVEHGEGGRADLPAGFFATDLGQKILRHFSVEALAQALGAGRLEEERVRPFSFNIQNLAPERVVDWMPAADFEAVRARYQAASSIERVQILDTYLNRKWRDLTTQGDFEVVNSYLKRPVDSTWAPSAATLARVSAATTKIAQLTNGYGLLMRTTMLRIAPTILSTYGEGMHQFLTTEERELFALIFAHANQLERAHRHVIEVGSTWSPAQAVDFYAVYSDLAMAVSNSIGYQFKAESFQSIWLEMLATPLKFRTRLLYPLEGLLSAVLNDEQNRYIVAKVRQHKSMRSKIETSGEAVGPSSPSKINLPVVDFGLPDVCRNAAPGTYQVSAGIAIECTPAVSNELRQVAISPEFMVGLIEAQSDSFLSHAPNQLALAPYWTDQVRAGGLRMGMDQEQIDKISEKIFFANPFLTKAKSGRFFAVDLRVNRRCVNTNGDEGVDWACIAEIIRGNERSSGDAGAALTWLNARPQIQGPLKFWTQTMTSRRKLKRTTKLSATIGNGISGVEEEWGDTPESPMRLIWSAMAIDGWAYLVVNSDADLKRFYDGAGLRERYEFIRVPVVKALPRRMESKAD